MDIQDVSSEAQFIGMMQQIQAAAEKAARRKGQKPRDHPPPQLLIQSFMMKIQMNAPAMHNRYNIATSQIPAPYPPCVLPAAELKPIAISRMELETHHRGHRIVVRALTPPDRITAVMAIVEDEEGTAVLMQLYHQAPEEIVPAASTVKPGRLFLLKEPFFKASTDGSYSLRADHVSDVMLLDETNELVPVRWRKKAKAFTGASSSGDLRMRGNEAVGKQEWAEAERLYSSAIDTSQAVEDEQLALLNRSLANLRLGRPASALADAAKANEINTSEKSLFREASALYQLGRFEECLSTLKTLTTSFPSSDAATPMLKRVKTRLHEQQTGEYDFRAMHKQARATPPSIDCATYSEPVEVRASPGRGRGLFTTRKVVAGELLVCEKALGYKYAGDDQPGMEKILMNVVTKRMTIGSQADLLTQIVQKLYHDHVAAREFLDLHHGEYEAVSADVVDGRPVVDSFLVERVLALTAFGAPRCSRNRVLEDNDNKSDKGTHKTTGVFPLVAHINHACISNSHRSFIGDVQIVRATRDLEADTELFFWYQVPHEFDSYGEAQKRLDNWGFMCECALCLARKNTPRKSALRRKALYEDLNREMGQGRSSARAFHVDKARQVLHQLEQTYSTPEREPGAVRLELWDPYIALGRALLVTDKPVDSVEVTVRGLAALGFVIVMDLPKQGKVSQRGKPEFYVKQWGLANGLCVDAFLTLFLACQILAPELLMVAREYVGTAFSMVYGEKDTVLDAYPELR